MDEVYNVDTQITRSYGMAFPGNATPLVLPSSLHDTPVDSRRPIHSTHPVVYSCFAANRLSNNVHENRRLF